MTTAADPADSLAAMPDVVARLESARHPRVAGYSRVRVLPVRNDSFRLYGLDPRAIPPPLASPKENHHP